MNEHGEFETDDVVLLEDTGDEFDGRAGRVIEEHNGLVNVKIVIPATGDFVDRIYSQEALGLVTDEGLLLIETKCSGCGKLNWDNKTGGYSEQHHNADTGIDVLCDDKGRTYVNGDLVPPRKDGTG